MLIYAALEEVRDAAFTHFEIPCGRVSFIESIDDGAGCRIQSTDEVMFLVAERFDDVRARYRQEFLPPEPIPDPVRDPGSPPPARDD